MARDLTDDDRDKDVVTAGGTRVGTVSSVQDGQARVTPDNDSGELTDTIKSMLGWDDSDEDQTLRNDDVDSVNDNEVRLRSQ
ncbi:hypothetical protein BRC68_16825 [Halobacteriales archaeon QH_6_64_20]|nr:MAG: hypothetical protein BRC68_16825 [Halobacteriales archaeon QH_6_64_20]